MNKMWMDEFTCDPGTGSVRTCPACGLLAAWRLHHCLPPSPGPGLGSRAAVSDCECECLVVYVYRYDTLQVVEITELDGRCTRE